MLKNTNFLQFLQTSLIKLHKNTTNLVHFVVQPRLSQSLFTSVVPNMLLQQIHNLVVVLIRRWLHLCRPVEDVPVVRRLVDQLVVELRLLHVKVFEVALSEGAEEQAVLQHSALS
jgi:hypothetical protein